MRKRDYSERRDKRQSRRITKRSREPWRSLSKMESGFFDPAQQQAAWDRIVNAQEALRREGGDYMNLLEVAKRSLPYPKN